jgi:chemotaxis protein MotB
MAKKGHHEEEHENHERWLVSYADFITLLFAFFVVMYSVSRVDTKRLVQVLESVKFALHFQGSGGVAKMPVYDGPPSVGGCVANLGAERGGEAARVDIDPVRKRVERRVQHLLRKLNESPRSVVVAVEGNRLTVRLAARRFFDPQRATLRPEMLPVLQGLGEELARLERPLEIGGHASEELSAKGPFRNDWELSGVRAAAVARYLEKQRLFRARDLSAVGYADTHPLSKADTDEARAANRRVDLSVELGVADPLGVLGT